MLFEILPCLAVAQEPAAVPDQTIRVNVERVNVGVVVTDAKGKFVEGLRREDFQVLDNGTAQPISEFASIDAPGQILMLVEAGPAVYLLRDAHLFVADSLLNGLVPADSVAIAAYTDAPAPILNFTTDKRIAQAALDQMQFNLGYGDLNLSSSLNTVLDWIAPISGKKTIVLISTGVDTSPQSAMQSALFRLQSSDVQILAISMTGPFRNSKGANKGKFQETMETLQQADAWLSTLAQATGGRAYFPENAKAFQETYRQIAEIVRHEYSLAFVPPVADGAVHTIDVKVDLTDANSNTPNGKTPNANNPSTKPSNSKPADFRVNHRHAYSAPKQ